MVRLSRSQRNILCRSLFPLRIRAFRILYQNRRLRRIVLKSCVKCGKCAKIECPKCIELKLPIADASYCSLECYHTSWSTHNRLIHDDINDDNVFCLSRGLVTSHTLPTFDWTGPLRPHPILRKLQVPKHIAQPEYALDGEPKSEPYSELQYTIEVKTREQIQRMRQACMIARNVLDAAALIINPGITTNQIDVVVHEATVAAGGYSSPLNYYFFPKSCYTSVNEVICHGIPDTRVLEDGDIVTVGVAVYYGGVHGRLSETFFVGKVDEESKRLVQCAYECLEKSIAIVKPLGRFRHIGDVISQHASSSGFSVVKSYSGHGIGEFFHCAPVILNYAGNRVLGVMLPGQTFTISPMINSGVWRDLRWPDGWTAVTDDGRRSASFEHTVLVTDTGVEVLTARLSSSPGRSSYY